MKYLFFCVIFCISTVGYAVTKTPDLMRLVCEEVDYKNIKTGKLMIIDQVSANTMSGTDLIKEANRTGTRSMDFYLRIFNSGLVPETDKNSINQQVESIIRTKKPSNNKGEGIIGEGRTLRNTFIFSYNGEEKIKFKLSFNALKSGNFFINSQNTTGYSCIKPYTIPEPKKQQDDTETMSDEYEQDSSTQ